MKMRILKNFKWVMVVGHQCHHHEEKTQQRRHLSACAVCRLKVELNKIHLYFISFSYFQTKGQITGSC